MDKNELIRKALRVKVGSKFKYQKELNELGLVFEANGNSVQGYYSVVKRGGHWLTKTLVISKDYSKKSRIFDPYSLKYDYKGSIKSDLKQDLANHFNL